MKSKAIVVVLLATSCATIINGPTETVSVSSNPPGATVTDGKTSKVTPTQFVLDRDHDYILTISKPGFETEHVKIEHVISGWVAGNLLSFGILGAGVDATSGAMWRLTPDTIVVTLHPRPPSPWYFFKRKSPSDSVVTTLEKLNKFKQENYLTQEEYDAIVCVLMAIACTGYNDRATDTRSKEKASL